MRRLKFYIAVLPIGALLSVHTLAAGTAAGTSISNQANVSFVIGADFAVGDNKTLMHLAQTLAETWSRRVAEYAAWEEFSKN